WFISVLKRLEHPTVQAVNPCEQRLDAFELPAREARSVVEHRPVRAGEVERQEVDALARQVAGQFVHRAELGVNVCPEFLLAFRQTASSLAVDKPVARNR